jgi:hypothetical protein
MTDLSFDYVEAQKALDIGDMADTKSLAKIARVHAQATVDIAASLAMIVELLAAPERRREEYRSSLIDVEQTDDGAPEPSPDESGWPIGPATDVEPGDLVASAHDGVIKTLIEVVEVGTTEGDVWLKLDGVKGKKWARDYVIVERGVGGDFE